MGGRPIFDADLSPDGNRAALALSSGEVLIRDLSKGTIIAALEGHRGPVTTVCFSSDGQHVLSGSYDRRVIFWRIRDHRIIQTFRGHDDVISVVDLSTDGRTAASGTETGTVIYWNVETGKEISRIQHGIDELKRRLFMDINRSAEAVQSLSLSHDGRRALISFLDDTPILWDFDQERAVKSLRGHSQVVLGLSLHDDDRLAISGDRDGRVSLWDVSQGVPINCLLLDGSTSSTAFVSNRVLIGDVRGQVTFLEIIGTKSKNSNMAPAKSK